MDPLHHPYSHCTHLPDSCVWIISPIGYTCVLLYCFGILKKTHTQRQKQTESLECRDFCHSVTLGVTALPGFAHNDAGAALYSSSAHTLLIVMIKIRQFVLAPCD